MIFLKNSLIFWYNNDKLPLFSTTLPVLETILLYEIRKKSDFCVGLRLPSVSILAQMSLCTVGQELSKVGVKHQAFDPSFSGEKDIKISEEYALPVFGSFIYNPDAEAAFLVFGFSF